MNCTHLKENYKINIEKAIDGLASFIYQGLIQGLEPIRLARTGCVLLSSGCSRYGTIPGDVLAKYIVSAQGTDGGWTEVEETIWCLKYISSFGKRYRNEMSKGRKWLTSVRLPCGALGKSSRDQPRIPITALAATLAPKIVGSAGLEWLEQQWEADLSNSTQLTYKGAFFLLAHAHNQASFGNNLVKRTIAYLDNEQEEDGGYGPWKGHPVGSDPWSTGIVLWGLSKVQEKATKQTIEKALSWLSSKQLDNGLWPYHYLDDGAAMALIGIASNLRFLME
jgi:hypothetical protein